MATPTRPGAAQPQRDMKTTTPRLRSVRMKSGGAAVTVFHNSNADHFDETGRNLVADARAIAQYGGVRVYAVVAIHEDEGNSVGMGGAYNLRAFPAMAHDIILQELATREWENS